MINYDELMKVIGYKFKNVELLDTALTHISYANESGGESYERLEFLGDAVIELVVSDYIVRFKELDAGVLSKLRASLVSTENLAKISTMLSVMQNVKKSRSLSVFSKKNTADIIESIVGAIYLDNGIEEARKFIMRHIIVDDANVLNMLKSSIDYKTKFQELMQKNAKKFEYKLLASTGKDHDKTFECGLYIEGELCAISTGKSIQLAEENCARKYFEKK